MGQGQVIAEAQQEHRSVAKEERQQNRRLSAHQSATSATQDLNRFSILCDSQKHTTSLDTHHKATDQNTLCRQQGDRDSNITFMLGYPRRPCSKHRQGPPLRSDCYGLPPRQSSSETRNAFLFFSSCPAGLQHDQDKMKDSARDSKKRTLGACSPKSCLQTRISRTFSKMYAWCVFADSYLEEGGGAGRGVRTQHCTCTPFLPNTNLPTCRSSANKKRKTQASVLFFFFIVKKESDEKLLP